LTDGARAATLGTVTLADLLVSLAVLGLVVGATLVMLEQGQQAWHVGAARVESQQSARLALTWLAAELRAAGQGRGAPSLSVVEPTRVVLHLDRDGDGVIAGSGETIVWRLDRDILRRDAGGGAQPVINGVRTLALTYFDAAGQPTADPGAVRRIAVTLATRADHARSLASAGLGAVVTTEVHIRNR
jgi:hypothetical protein